MEEDIGERLREAACIGDVNLVQKLQAQGADVNSKNSINGWTALHWAAKRNHITVVKLLLDNGAKTDIANKDNQQPAQLSSNPEIRQLLGASPDTPAVQTALPITPNYLANPPFPYTTEKSGRSSFGDSSTIQYHHQIAGNINASNSHGNSASNSNELVLKCRVANSDEKDFIEVELNRNGMSYGSLLNLMCAELGVDKGFVAKVRKLPDTIVRKDKDVFRLKDFQELELVLTNKVISASSRTYNGLAPARSNETILY